MMIFVITWTRGDAKWRDLSRQIAQRVSSVLSWCARARHHKWQRKWQSVAVLAALALPACTGPAAAEPAPCVVHSEAEREVWLAGYAATIAYGVEYERWRQMKACEVLDAWRAMGVKQ
jgi:hypothetical protein